jgi:hypothetical protein
MTLLGWIIGCISLFTTGVAAQLPTTSLLAEVNYATSTSQEILAFLPIEELQSTQLSILSGVGFANSHVTVFQATVIDEHSDYFGWVTVQTKPNGNYTLIFNSRLTYATNTAFSDVSATDVGTSVTCYAAAPEDSMRTCSSTAHIASGTTATSTLTFNGTAETDEPYTMTRPETFPVTYSTQISESFLVSMDPYMQTVSLDELLTRRSGAPPAETGPPATLSVG